MVKKSFLSLILFLVLLIPAAYAADEPTIKAGSAILALANGGQIVFDKNSDGRVFPSGLTKLMTALAAYERLGMDASIEVSENISDYVSELDLTMNLKPGELLTSGDLIKSIIAGGANDAAIVLALESCGAVDEFVALMNTRAAELGMSSTAFVNPTGIHSEYQYTTARDMLALYKALRNLPMIKSVLDSQYITVPATNTNAARTYWTQNSLATGYYTSKYLYQYAKGGKTSSSSSGGYSIICGAVKRDVELICVVLNSALDGGVNYSFVDAKNMFEYGFNSFTLNSVTVQDSIVREIKVKNAKGTNRVLLQADNTLRCLILDDDDITSITSELDVPEYITAPLKKGDAAGKISYSYRGRPVGTVTLTVGNDISSSGLKATGNAIAWFFSLKVIKIILFVILAAVALYAAAVITLIRKTGIKKRRRKRRRRG